MSKDVCTICRRLRQKLFLKGEKCISPKCPVVKRPYPPGVKGKRAKGKFSEYEKELFEKQKMRSFYGISEKQFKNYVKEILKKRGKIEDTALELVKKLEKRLDNVVFRLGFATSRAQARQLVNHGHFLVNGKPVDIPSYQVRKGDVISVREYKKGKPFYKKTSLILKKIQPPSWLKLDKEKFSGEVIGEPSLEEAGVPAEIPSIFEFYAR